MGEDLKLVACAERRGGSRAEALWRGHGRPAEERERPGEAQAGRASREAGEAERARGQNPL